MYVRYFGGLGNQLFQLNFAKHLERVYGEPVKMLKSRHTARRDRQPLLDEFLSFLGQTCAYPPLSLSLPKLSLFSGVAHRLDRLGMRYVDSSASPWATPQLENFPKTKETVFYGYFQNSNLVESNSGLIVEPLMSFLKTKAIVARQRLEISDREVLVHIRRGDTLSASTRCMGTLNQEYYLQALSDLGPGSIRPIVVTDDPKNSIDVAGKIGASRVLGPDDCTPWEALALFATAHSIIAANSTLSWWGAYLSAGRTKNSFIPSPWFRDCDPGPGTALQFKGARLIPSAFS